MGRIKEFLDKESFWKLYPGLEYIPEFKEIHDRDKSKNKMDSSKVMWAIAYLVDNSEANTYNGYSIDERKEVLKANFLNQPLLNWDTHSNRIEKFKEWCRTPEEKTLAEFDELMEDRKKLIKDKNYESAASLDKLVKTYDIIVKTRQGLKSLAEDSNETGERVEGGKKRSLNEKGDI